MKQILSALLVAIILSACGTGDPTPATYNNGTEVHDNSPEDVHEVTYDGCQYIHFSYSDPYIHKGNCKNPIHILKQ